MDKLSGILNYIFFGFLAIILLVVATFGVYAPKVISPLWIILSMGLAFFFLVKMHRHTIKKIDEINVNYLFAGLLVIFILVQVGFIYVFKMYPDWDFGWIAKMARDASENLPWELSQRNYLRFYPYNFSLVVVYQKLFTKFAPVHETLFYFGIVCIALTQGIIFQLLKKNFSKATVIKVVILLFAFYPYVAYTLIPYSDVVALPFFALGLLAVLKNREVQLTIPAILLFTFAVGLGSNFKILILILAIAYAIYWIIHFQKWKTILVIIPLCSYLLFNNYFADQWNISSMDTPYPKGGITPLYFISLGLNTETMGRYNPNEYDKSMGFSGAIYDGNTKIVTEFYANQIVERFSVSPLLLAELYYNKIYTSFGQGDYLMSEYIMIRPIKTDSNLRSFFTEGFGKDLLYYYAQTMHFMFLMAMTWIGYCDIKTRNLSRLWTKTIFVGFFLYFMMFEAGARYGLLLTPLLFYFIADFFEQENGMLPFREK